MIEELCLMDLLTQEKEAVLHYNVAISCIEDNEKYRYKSLKERPEDTEAIERYYEKELSCYIEKKEKAGKQLSEIREKIKQYFLSI